MYSMHVVNLMFLSVWCVRLTVPCVSVYQTEELSDNKAKSAASTALTDHLQAQIATLEDRLRDYQIISQSPKLYEDIYDDNSQTLVRKKKVSRLCTDVKLVV